eukprot:scaffold4240_cov163-Amphora_coffeaeformis.AAC.5
MILAFFVGLDREQGSDDGWNNASQRLSKPLCVDTFQRSIWDDTQMQKGKGTGEKSCGVGPTATRSEKRDYSSSLCCEALFVTWATPGTKPSGLPCRFHGGGDVRLHGSKIMMSRDTFIHSMRGRKHQFQKNLLFSILFVVVAIPVLYPQRRWISGILYMNHPKQVALFACPRLISPRTLDQR